MESLGSGWIPFVGTYAEGMSYDVITSDGRFVQNVVPERGKFTNGDISLFEDEIIAVRRHDHPSNPPAKNWKQLAKSRPVGYDAVKRQRVVEFAE